MAGRRCGRWKKYVNAPSDGWQVDYDESTSWVSKHPHTTLDDIRKAMPQKARLKGVKEDFTQAFMVRKNAFDPQDVLMLPWCRGFLDITYRYVDYELFCLGMYSEPELIEELLRRVLGAAKGICRYGYRQAILRRHLCTATILRIKMRCCSRRNGWKRTTSHGLKSCLHRQRQLESKVIYHSDGHLNEIMDNLVACGIDALNPLEKLAGMDIVEIRRKYPRLVLTGGIDCSELLSFGSKEDIREEIERIVYEFGAEGGILLGSSSEVHNGIPAENCKFMYDTIRELSAKL